MKRGIIASSLILLILFSNISFSLALSEYNLVYDDNGNLIQGFSKYYEYNNFNELSSVRENDASGNLIAEYSYDHGGNRLRKIKYHGDRSNTTTYYIGKSFVQIVNSSGVYNETYYYDEDDLIARNDSSGISYYHPDHLGSTSMMTNESGDVIEETFYLPYGEILEGGDSRYLFTGKEKDVETGLMYYGARYYDSYLRHFVQPDMVIGDVYDPQQLNRYSYVRNNPYKYTDPSGNFINWATGAIGAIAGAVIGAVTSIVSQYTSTGSIGWGNVGKSAVVGGVAGGIAGLTFGAGSAMISSAGLTGGYATVAQGGVFGISGVVGGQVARGGGNIVAGNPITQGLFQPRGMATDFGIGVGTFGVFKSAGAGISALRGGTGRINKPGPFTTRLSDGTIREYGKFTPATKPGSTAGARGVKEILTDETKRFIYESYDKYGRVTQIHPKSPKDLGHFEINPKTGKIIGWRP